MTISPDQLRAALGELNGQRDARFEFDHADSCTITKALLVPAESDKIIKVTDGSHIYFIDAERVAWVEIG